MQGRSIASRRQKRTIAFPVTLVCMHGIFRKLHFQSILLGERAVRTTQAGTPCSELSCSFSFRLRLFSTPVRAEYSRLRISTSIFFAKQTWVRRESRDSDARCSNSESESWSHKNNFRRMRQERPGNKGKDRKHRHQAILRDWSGGLE